MLLCENFRSLKRTSHRKKTYRHFTVREATTKKNYHAGVSLLRKKVISVSTISRWKTSTTVAITSTYYHYYYYYRLLLLIYQNNSRAFLYPPLPSSHPPRVICKLHSIKKISFIYSWCERLFPASMCESKVGRTVESFCAIEERENAEKNIRYNFLRGYKSEKSRRRKRMRAKRNKEKLSQVDLMTKKTRKNCFASFNEISYRTVG